MQFFIFLICLCCGIVGGVFYDILYVVRTLIFGRAYTRGATVAAAVCDVLFFAFLAALFVFSSVLFCFPDVRFYMILGCFGGVLLYLKSFHIFVAFFVNKLYNRRRARSATRARTAERRASGAHKEVTR